MTLAAALERAAAALPGCAEAIWPANGDPSRLLAALDTESARAVLVWLLEQQPEAGRELLMAWAEHEEGAAPIAAVDSASLSRFGRKALGRAAHRLRSRGISLPEAESPPVVASLPGPADDFGGALLSLPDPGGAQYAVSVQIDEISGGGLAFTCSLDWERGLLEFRRIVVTRSEARKWMRDLQRDDGIAAIPRPAWAALVVRVGEGAGGHTERRPLSEDFDEWRRRDCESVEDVATPGELARRALEPELPVAWRQELADVTGGIGQGLIGPWPPPPEHLDRLAARMRAMLASAFLINEDQRQRQSEVLLGDLAEERYAAPAGERTAERLDHTAYVLWKRRGQKDAIPYIAAARAFRELPHRDNPVARALLARSLKPLLEAWRERDAGSLIVRP